MVVDTISLTSTELTKFFFAIILLLASSHLFGHLFHRLKMPRVIGEIFGGLLLGPTLLGYFAPKFYDSVFSTQGNLLAIIYWLGLLLLMFTSGFEIQTNFDKKDKRTVIALVIGSTLIPFLFGWWITSFFDISNLIGPKNNSLALKLIVSVAIAITSIPVISKIFIDLDIIKTKFAKIILGAATIHDIILWVFVTIATSIVAAVTLSVNSIVIHVLITLAFFVISIYLLPILIRFTPNIKKYIVSKNLEMAFSIVVLMFFVVIASYFEINIIFGAFLGGIVIGFLNNQKFDRARSSIKDFSLAFFVPIYFAIVGIKLDLIHHFDFLLFLGFFLFSTFAQVTAVTITSKLLRYGWLSSINMALAMNARGGPGIVLGTLAFDLGIISENFFVVLVINAIVTSLLGGIWLRYVISKKWPLLD